MIRHAKFGSKQKDYKANQLKVILALGLSPLRRFQCHGAEVKMSHGCCHIQVPLPRGGLLCGDSRKLVTNHRLRYKLYLHDLLKVW